MRQMEEQKMSSQERIQNNIRSIQEEILRIDDELAKIVQELKNEDLSQDEKNQLQTDLEGLTADQTELSFDLAILEELLNKILMDREDRNQYEYDDGNCGLDWNESGYFD
jgi:hypothetical protein